MNAWRKDIAAWAIGKTLHMSVVFSWDVERAVAMAREATKAGQPVIVGGPAAMLNREAFDGVAEVRDHCDEVEPVLFHNPLASCSSRGCIRRCPFCVVPDVEGELRQFFPFRPAPMMYDNNFLATTRGHQIQVVDALRQFDEVDFNQGLDARLFTPEAADNLGRLRLHARFAFDHANEEAAVYDSVLLCRERTTRTISVYVLIGFDDTPDEARHRLELVRSWGIRPNPMRYQPKRSEHKDEFIAPGWTQEELRRMMKYYSRLRWYEHIPYDEFRPPQEALFDMGAEVRAE